MVFKRGAQCALSRAANCGRWKIRAENFRKVLMIGHAIGSARDRCWCKSLHLHSRREHSADDLVLKGSSRTSRPARPWWPCHNNRLWMIQIDRTSYIAKNLLIMIHDIRWLRLQPRCTKIWAKSKSVGRSVGQSEIGAKPINQSSWQPWIWVEFSFCKKVHDGYVWKIFARKCKYEGCVWKNSCV